MDRCKSCGERSVILDPTAGIRVCSSCGVEQSSDNFQTEAFTSDGRFTGALVRSIGDFSYRDRKIQSADAQISDLTSRLDLSAARSDDIRSMISELTEGEFGAGEWFPVLVAACACITTRRNHIPLPIAAAAAAIGCEVHEVGRMVARVSEFSGYDRLPQFDIVQSLEQTVRRCPSLKGVEEEKTEEMVRQGRFLMQCAVKWFLTTGRQPLPVVAAVAAFVAEVNGVTVVVELIAKEIYATAATSKLRKKELLETLVKVARALLPWGEDVTVKNIVHNAPLLLRYMEMKSKSGNLDLEQFGFCTQGMFDGYLYSEENDSKYFNVGDRDGAQGVSCDELERLKLSEECLSRAYKKALEGCDLVKMSGEFGKSHRRRKRGNIVFEARMDCKSGKKLSLEQILERNVGFDALPPSFVAGLEAREGRRKKIDAAKLRISEVMKKLPSSVDSATKEEVRPSSGGSRSRKRRRQEIGGGVTDWEDCIVELLLLHRVNEEEIERGHYNRLLDLHVFNSSDTQT